MALQTARESMPDREETHHLPCMFDNPERKPTRFGFRRSVVTNWSDLRPGDTVVLVGTSNERVSGTVDAVTTEGDMVWILQDNGAGRKLFHKSDRYQTLTDPKAL
jgi:hypothetical protein